MLQALGGGVEQLQTAMGESQIQQNQVVTISQESIQDIEAAIGRAVGPLVPAPAPVGVEAAPVAAVQAAIAPEQAADSIPSAQEIKTEPDVLDVNLVSLGDGAEREFSTLFSGLFDFAKPSGKAGPAGASAGGGGDSKDMLSSLVSSLGGLMAGAGVGIGAAGAGVGYGTGKILEGGGGLLSGAGKGVGGIFKGVGEGIGSIFHGPAAAAPAPAVGAGGGGSVGFSGFTGSGAMQFASAIQLALVGLHETVKKCCRAKEAAKKKPESPVARAKEKIADEEIVRAEKQIEVIEATQPSPAIAAAQPEIEPVDIIEVGDAGGHDEPTEQNLVAGEMGHQTETRVEKISEIQLTADHVNLEGEAAKPEAPETVRAEAPAKKAAEKKEQTNFFQRFNDTFLKETTQKTSEKETIVKAQADPGTREASKEKLAEQAVTVAKAETSTATEQETNPDEEPEKKQKWYQKGLAGKVGNVVGLNQEKSFSGNLLSEVKEFVGIKEDKEDETDEAEGAEGIDNERLFALLENMDTNIEGLRGEFPEAIASIQANNITLGGGGGGNPSSVGDNSSPLMRQREKSRRS
jgi:hypothetical protein